MARRALRVLLFAIVTMALWSVTRPAMAMPAGFCDDRGATAVAADPLLVTADAGSFIAVFAPSCDGDDGALVVALSPGHAGTTFTAIASDPALPTATLAVLPASGALRPSPSQRLRAPGGVRSSIERPPRS